MTTFIRDKIQVANADARMVRYHGHPSEPPGFDPRNQNIFLVGLRGCGKSTLGALLAKRLNMTFVDTDAIVEEQAGQSIAQIVAARGWERFRALETDVLRRISAETGQVIATGGGIVLSAENRKLLQDHGTTFYLLADVHTLVRRLGNDPNVDQRPALSGLPLAQEIAQCHAQRGSLYMCVADHILHADAPLDQIMEDAASKLGLV
jgi:shikimate kinase